MKNCIAVQFDVLNQLTSRIGDCMEILCDVSSTIQQLLLEGYFATSPPVEPPAFSPPMEVASPPTEAASSTDPPAEAPEFLSFEEVRHQITLVAQSGYAVEVKELLGRYGARRLADIDPEKFDSLLRDAARIREEASADVEE